MFTSIEIIKLECVEDYQKRVRTKLQNLKKKEKGLGGSCRLTDTTVDRLENYEGVARFLQNVGNLHNIKSIHHCPHSPIGSDSLCKYNAGRANV